MIAGHAEDLAGQVPVADRGVAGADAEISGRQGHGVGGLTEVVVVDEEGAVVVGPGDDRRDRRRGSGDVPALRPTVDSALSWSGSVTMMNTQWCRLG